MVGASFAGVGNANAKIALSTLTISGYEDSAYLWDAGEFNASFQILNGDGTPNRTYYYSNVTQDGEVWDGATWKDKDGEVITSANEVWLDSGVGMWLTVPGTYEVDALRLGSSGEVLRGDRGVEGEQGTYRSVCNPLPATAKLSQCEIQGYEDSPYLWDAGEFNASFQVLNGDGTPNRTYYYSNVTQDGEVWDGATWKDKDGNVITDANDVDITSGMGLWLTVPGAYSVDCISMVFPKVID